MAKYDFWTTKRSGKLYSNFSLTGVDALMADLERMSGDMLGEEGKKIVAGAVKPVSYRIQANAPVGETGMLSASVRTTKGRVQNDRRGPGARVVAAALVGSNKRATASGSPRPAYALQVEYGTPRRGFSDEQPFVRPAFDGYETSMGEDVRRRLRLRVIKWKFHEGVGRKPPKLK